MSIDLTLHRLHNTLLGSLHAALGCDAAFCYAGWSSGAHFASGALLLDDVVKPLPERPLDDLLAGAGQRCSIWARSDACVAYAPPCVIVDTRGEEVLGHAFAAYLYRESRCVGIFGAELDPHDPKRGSYPAKLLQVGAALATLIGLHNESRGLLVRTVKATAPSPLLSKREHEIASLLVAGYAAVNVAAILGISEHTVRTYIRRLYRKLRVTNRAELVRQCVGMTTESESITTDSQTPSNLTP